MGKRCDAEMTGSELKRLIASHGYTQAGLATQIGIAPRTMRKYISEELTIPTQTEIAIRCVLTHREKGSERRTRK